MISKYQPTNALNKTQLMIGITLLHVSAPEYQPQGIFQNKGIPVQHANLSIASPSLE